MVHQLGREVAAARIENGLLAKQSGFRSLTVQFEVVGSTISLRGTGPVVAITNCAVRLNCKTFCICERSSSPEAWARRRGPPVTH